MTKGSYSEQIGKFNNIRQEKFNQQKEQMWLNDTANRIGQTLTQEGIGSFAGYLYMSNILGNIRIAGDVAPNRQQMVKNNLAVFEADTYVKVRQEGQVYTMDGLSSSSSANPKYFSSPIVNETVSPTIEGQPSTNPMIYLADKAHQWSLSMHQLAHGISTLANCTTTKELSYQKQHGLWESLNHTQVHFKTICQNAVAKAHNSNEQQTPPLQNFHFEQRTKETDSPYFTAKEAAEKLKNIFESDVHSPFKSTHLSPSDSNTQKGLFKEDSLISSFWKDITEQFALFFSASENASYIEQTTDLNGTSVLDLFIGMMSRVFSSNEEQPSQSNKPTDKPVAVPPIATLLPESIQIKSNPIIPTEEGGLTQLWNFINKLSDTLDRFIEKWDILKIQGVEAAPWFDVNPLNPRYDHRLEAPLRSYETLQMATSYSVFLVTKQYIRYKSPELTIGDQHLPFWYNYALFQRRNETEKINAAVKKYLRGDRVGWWVEDDTPMRFLFHGLQKFEDNREIEEVIARRTVIAHVIFDTCGLSTHGMTDERANAIYLQWRNNNAFKNVQFKIVKKIVWTPSNDLSNDERNRAIQSTPSTVPSQQPELARLDQLVTELMNDRQPFVGEGELLPIFYYHYDLFKQRARTSKVNQELKKLLDQEGIRLISESRVVLINAVKKYAGQEVGPKKSYKSRKIQYLAFVILKAYGVGQHRLGDSLSPNQLLSIFMQWKTNTLLEKNEYKKIDPQTTHYKLSPWEDPIFARKQEQRSESNQIYEDFINKRDAMLSHEHPLIPYVYYLPLFQLRRNIPKGNIEMRKKLVQLGIPVKDETLQAVAIAVDNWIMAGEKYKIITKRVKKVAKIISNTYKLDEKDLSINKAFAIYLQWGNNNAYYGYTLEEDKINDAYDLNTRNKKEETEKKVIDFLRENELDVTNSTSTPVVFSLPSFTPAQNEDICKNITSFLSEKGVSQEIKDKLSLVKIASNWALVAGAKNDTIDVLKVKELAQLILGNKAEKTISNEEAQQIFAKWMMDTIEMATSSEVKENKQSHTISKAIRSKWQAENIKKTLEIFFQQKGLLAGQPSKEELIAAVGKWFTQEGVGMVLMPDKVQIIAKMILNELDLYGGKSEEVISNKDAETTVIKWVFETVLEKPIETYLVQNITSAPDLSTYTIGDLRKLFEVDELEKNGLIDFTHLKQPSSSDDQKTLVKLWILFTQKMLPNYFLETSQLSDELLISDYDSLMQLIGSKFLEDVGYRSRLDRNEISMLGMFLFDVISHQGVDNLNELPYLLVPALLATAQLEPDRLKMAMELGIHKEFALSSFMSYYQKGSFDFTENQEDIEQLYEKYQEAVINWRRKLALVDEVLAECDRLGIKVSVLGDQAYLAGGNPCPGPYIPRDLEKWYTELTKEVADTHREFNKKLMEFAFHSMGIEDFNYLVSPNTHIYEAFAQLKNEVHYHAPSAPGSISPVFFGGRETWLDTTLNLEQTNLLVAVNGKEERRYALKKLGQEGGYGIYRVDNDPMLYFKYGLFDQKNIWGEGYTKEGEKIRIGKKLYTFSSQVDRINELTSHGDLRTVIDKISQKHREQLYQQLYNSGDAKTVAQTVWDGIKHFIPFYDCIVGISNQDAKGAAISCTIDVVFLLPVLGQVTSLNLKFGLGVAKSIVIGGAEGMVKNSLRVLPNIVEVESLVMSVIRYIDPGFELMKGSSKLLLKKLVNMKTRAFIRKEVKPILVKLDRFNKATEPLSTELISAQLPNNGPKIFVKRVKADLYLRVTDLKTRDVFGQYYTLRGGQLREFEGAATFTSDQLDLIQRLSSKVDMDQQFVEEKNLNVKFYGEGMIHTGKKQGVLTNRYIVMQNKFIPVRETAIKGQGVRYDVCEDGRVLPVNYNGIEWYFEPTTSRMLSEEVVQKISPTIDEFQSLKDPSTLSPPNDLGLMVSETDRSYIKINEHYVPLVLFNKEKLQYHLVKKDILAPMTILRLDLVNDQFRFETELEKRSHDFRTYAQQAGGKQVADDEIPSTSKGADSLFDHIESASSQVFVDDRYPPYSKLPDMVSHAEDWKKLRHSEEVPDFPDFVEDPNVPLPPLTEFVPEWPSYIRSDEDGLRTGITRSILSYFPKEPKPNYRVFSGIDLTNSPESLKPFRRQFVNEFKNAQEIIQKFIDKEKEVSRHGTLATTEVGNYLIKMFGLDHLQNQEQILREVMKRLASVAKKALQVLQQTEDFGFKNIWLVSTDLMRDEVTKQYYSSYKEMLGAYAFVMLTDPECRIMFMVDSFHMNPAISPGYQINRSPLEILMHEVTHLGATAADLATYESAPLGFSNSGQDIQKMYVDRVEDIVVGWGFDMFVDSIRKMTNLPNLAKTTVIKALKTDPMLVANLQITDAEVLMTCIRDIGLGRNFFQRPVVKRSLDSQLGKGDILFAFAMSQVFNINSLVKVKEHQLNTTLEKAGMTTEMNISQNTQVPQGNRSLAEIKNIVKSTNNVTNTRITEEQKIRRRAELNL